MNIALRVLAVLLKILDWIAEPFLTLSSRGKHQKLPAFKNELLKISATDLAKKIRNREITSTEICQAYIARIKEVNPILNAVVEERFESALQEARNVDAYLQTSPLSNEELTKIKPLLGVPLTVKESCALAGLSLCGGTLARIGVKAHTDGDAVAKLRASGAIALLISNTPEICLSWECTNFITGTTKNPYNTTRTCSGSSGGEGALLGAGASVIGIGSDIAGSIRMPALFNGVFGHKPTPRVISIKGHYPYPADKNVAEYLVVGPLTRYAKDLKLMTKIMCNGKSAVLDLDENVDLSEINVFFMEEAGESIVLPKVQKEIKDAIKLSVEHLKNKCNTKIVDYKFKELEDSCEIAGTVLYKLKDIPNLLKGENHNLALEICKSLLGMSKYTFNLLTFYLIQMLYKTLIASDKYVQQNMTLQENFIKKLGTNGVFLYPTFPTSAIKHHSTLFRSVGVSYLMIVNSLGLPATHVPCGLDKKGLPIGLQVIAAPHQDRLCFAVAEELEKCFGGWTPPPI